MAATSNHQNTSNERRQPRQPLDPCQRMLRFGPIQPMHQQRSLLFRLLFD